jgi:hypothetical protein
MNMSDFGKGEMAENAPATWKEEGGGWLAAGKG